MASAPSWPTQRADEVETAAVAGHFRALAEEIGGAVLAKTPAGLVRLLVTAPHPDLCTGSGSFPSVSEEGDEVESGRPAKRAGLAQADG